MIAFLYLYLCDTMLYDNANTDNNKQQRLSYRECWNSVLLLTIYTTNTQFVIASYILNFNIWFIH